MKNLLAVAALAATIPAMAYEAAGPDGRLHLQVTDGPVYSLTYDGDTIVSHSPLGLVANFGDFSRGMTMTGHDVEPVAIEYSNSKIKKSHVTARYNRMLTHWANPAGQRMDIEFMVGNNDMAVRYVVPRDGETGAIRVMREATGYRFPEGTTTFLCPQSHAMVDWKRTKPSYEEHYTADAPMDNPSAMGHGYTFPGLFHTPAGMWVLLSETGVDSRYCGSRLSDFHDGLYTVELPMPEENNGNGTIEPAFALPGATPWRTVTVGRDLAPIAETTVMWDLVEPRYTSQHVYEPARGTWSWILWQDPSINYEDQQKYIDLAAAMGYEYSLIDNWWDTRIGREGIERLAQYARDKGVNLLMWYSSSGYWNDIEQGPVNIMDNSISRKREMKWLRDIGVKGIKVDFFGGDKQETMRLYEQILSDADDYGLMVIFHGCTLPRGWERMYPNYVGSEAVRASENLIFNQRDCDEEAFAATLHPFIRNTVGCMEYGGVFLNKRMNRTNDGGNTRRTTDVFQLATAILFQNPAQNFALAPNNLTDAPAVCIDFMKSVPTLWDDIRYIDGYPGRYAAIARRHGDTWYIAAINATDAPLDLELPLDIVAGSAGRQYYDGPHGSAVKDIRIPSDGRVRTRIPTGGGMVVTAPAR